jgi:5-methylcytosine-specific restriction endonuclease McrA
MANLLGRTWASQEGLYNTSSWRKLRNLKISNNPICELCAKMRRSTPARVVDHIIAVTPENWEDIFLDYENLQSLCFPCHGFKTGRDRGDARHSYDGEKGSDLLSLIADL